MGNFADHDQQRYAMLHDRGELIRCVADAFVVGKRNAAVATAVFKPLLVGTVLLEETLVPLDGQAGGREDFGEALA
jgi:hypothetical protein